MRSGYAQSSRARSPHACWQPLIHLPSQPLFLGSFTPPFHFVSLKPRRVATDREDEKNPAASLASKSRKEFRWLAQPPPLNCLLNYRTRPRSSGSRVFVQRVRLGAGIRPAAVPLRTSSQPFSSPSC